MDGNILVHENIHSLKTTKKPSMLVKLGIAKAYDKLSWKYMRGILGDFRFGREWIGWTMNTVTYSFYSILLNGLPNRIMNPTQGIRQGDPLSPFLFILMEEGLNRLIQGQSSNGEIRGLNIHRGVDKQTH